MSWTCGNPSSSGTSPRVPSLELGAWRCLARVVRESLVPSLPSLVNRGVSRRVDLSCCQTAEVVIAGSHNLDVTFYLSNSFKIKFLLKNFNSNFERTISAIVLSRLNDKLKRIIIVSSTIFSVPNLKLQMLSCELLESVFGLFSTIQYHIGVSYLLLVDHFAEFSG